MEEVLLQNEDLLSSAAGVRCVIGKVRSARLDRCKVQQLQPEKCWPCVTLDQMYSINDSIIQDPAMWETVCAAERVSGCSAGS